MKACAQVVQRLVCSMEEEDGAISKQSQILNTWNNIEMTLLPQRRDLATNETEESKCLVELKVAQVKSTMVQLFLEVFSHAKR